MYAQIGGIAASGECRSVEGKSDYIGITTSSAAGVKIKAQPRNRRRIGAGINTRTTLAVDGERQVSIGCSEAICSRVPSGTSGAEAITRVAPVELVAIVCCRLQPVPRAVDIPVAFGLY